MGTNTVDEDIKLAKNGKIKQDGAKAEADHEQTKPVEIEDSEGEQQETSGSESGSDAESSDESTSSYSGSEDENDDKDEDEEDTIEGTEAGKESEAKPKTEKKKKSKLEDEDDRDDQGHGQEDRDQLIKSSTQKKLSSALASLLQHYEHDQDESGHKNNRPANELSADQKPKAKAKSQLEAERSRIKRKRDKEIEEDHQRKENKKLKALIAERGHVKPTIVSDLERERRFLKTATQGVVTLFNAMNKYQSSLDTAAAQAAISEKQHKAPGVNKEEFLRLLTGNAKKGVPVLDEEKTKKKGWSALQDGFGENEKDYETNNNLEWEGEQDEEGGEVEVESE